jgi:hypothetical protein
MLAAVVVVFGMDQHPVLVVQVVAELEQVVLEQVALEQQILAEVVAQVDIPQVLALVRVVRVVLVL